MQTWLRDRGEPVPDATSTRHRMKMNGVEHEMLMPGMLTDEEMAGSTRARAGVRPPVPQRHDQASSGRDRHGRRALQATARRDETVFKFANDVYADQTIEIDRMNKMLEDGGSHK